MSVIHSSPRRTQRQRGASIVLFSLLSAIVIIPLIGLAIDGSIVFWAKAKLSAAVDAAALAAGRNVNVNYTTVQNSGPVATVAQQWFWANFPPSWLGATVTGPSISYYTTSASTQQVTVSASATIPLYFLRVIGQSSATVAATAQSSRRNTFIMLVLDRSQSMSWSGACPTMIADAKNFVNMFTDGFDTMGLVTFSATANLDVTPSTTFKTAITSALSNLVCEGTTSTAQGLNVAYQAMRTYGLAGGLNVIVLFTDGQPDEVVASFPVKTQADTRWSIITSPSSSAPSAQSYAASTCTSSANITGGLSIVYSEGQTAERYGPTIGLWNTSATTSINSLPSFLTTSGCNFSNSSKYGAYDALYALMDVAYIPNNDALTSPDNLNGNSTISGYGTNSPYFGSAPLVTVSTPDTFTSDTYAGYNGFIRPDEQTGALYPAAINATDYQAQVIRANTTYNPLIYTIGLGGATDMPVDDIGLERIANVNTAANVIYNSNEQTGTYVKAPTASQLNQAFQLVAGQILRLSK